MQRLTVRCAVQICILVLGLLAMAGTVLSLAQNETDLAKKVQNPVADLISVPLQSNFNFGTGPGDDLQYILNIQPVLPLRLSQDWNLIIRTIVPLIYQPELAPGLGDEFGLSDIQVSLFLSPAKSGAFVWGFGPVLQFPTATDEVLSTEKWSAGPTAVGLLTQGPWVVGALVNNLWSFAGDDDRADVNQMLLQPFVNYNLGRGFSLGSSPIITANWEADSNNRWTVPLGGGVAQVLRVGKQPMNFSLAGFYNIERPNNAPEWTLRFQIAFLFPKK